MGVNNSNITITEQVLLEQARKYDKTLRTLPMIAMQDTLQYVTVVPNVQGDLVLSHLKARSRWATYRNNDDQNTAISIDPRILTTRLCSLEVKFDPNQVAGKLYQQRPNTGDALKDVPIAAQVLMEIMREAGEDMNMALFSASFTANGKTETTCFDGWDTIAQKEITAGNIDTGKGNYLDLSANTIDQSNAFDAINYIYASCNEKLKGYGNINRPVFIYCSPNIQMYYNMGCKDYLGDVPYNKQWNQTSILGSDGKAILVPIISKAGSNFIQVTTKGNMLFGTDRLTDMNDLKVKVPELWDVLAGGTMWAGTQYESIEKENLLVAKIGGVAGPTNPFATAAPTPGAGA